jgi:UDP:flavonoid glycosyltransferase YjiC (YdhE family)
MSAVRTTYPMLKAFAAKHGIPRVHDSYEALINGPELDALYLPLPNGLHGRWTRAALGPGKHMLCEMPFTANAAKAREVAEAAARSDRVVWKHFTPLAQNFGIPVGRACSELYCRVAEYCTQGSPPSFHRGRMWIQKQGSAVKFALASYGTRGDVEPCLAVGRELQRRGHEVRTAVPPDLADLAEAAGLAAVAYGPDTQANLDAHRTYWTAFFRNFWNVPHLVSSFRELWQSRAQSWTQISLTLRELADGADLLFTGFVFEDTAANVAEYYDIPLATLHYFPVRTNGQLLSFLPPALGRFAMTVDQWLYRLIAKHVEDAQRRQLGLPKASGPASRRIAERGSLEIQAYDEVCFPGLAAQWAKFDGRRPIVGALSLELPTDADDQIASWIAQGSPPIYFGFGSIPVESAADTLTMIGEACAQLGERALVCSGRSDFGCVPRFEHVKVVGAVNFAAVFPSCRAVVHHGGAGTTAAGLRAGIPQLILPTDLDQTLWGARVKRLKVGTARRFSIATQESLVADLRAVLKPQYVARAREVATRMSRTAESVAAAADLVEDFARLRRVR